MKLPAFNFETAKWDAFRAFHNNYAKRYTYDNAPGHIIQFDTGELIIRTGMAHASLRGHYPSLGLSVWAVGDGPFKRVYHNGKVVPKSWLKYKAHEAFLFDHDAGRAYVLSRIPADKLPSRFASWNVAAYFNGRKVFANPIKLHKPAPPEVQRACRKIKLACKAWAALEYGDRRVTFEDQKHITQDYVASKTFAELTPDERLFIAFQKIKRSYTIETVPYLTFEP